MSGSSNQIEIYQAIKIQRPGYVYEVASLQTLDSIPPPVQEIYINDQNPLLANPEVFVMAFLLLTLPILVYLAYRYGKKMGRKEHPTGDHHDLAPELMKRRVSQESTSENSAHYQDKINSRNSSPGQSPVFNSVTSLQSFKKHDSPLLKKNDSPRLKKNDSPLLRKNDSPLSFALNKRERIDEEKIEDLSLDGRSSSWKSNSQKSEGQLVLKMNKVDDSESSEEAGNHKLIYKTAAYRKEHESEIHKEKLNSSSIEDKIVEKKAHVGVIFEKKDGCLQKTERDEIFMAFEQHKMEEHHGNAKPHKRSSLLVPQHCASSTNIFTTSPKNSADEKSQPNGILGIRASSVSPPLIPLEPEKRSRSQTEESKIETVIEKYGVPDETGKFKKIFKDVEFIGEGSFGEVCKVVHRLDGKLYAVKKVKLKLGRFEELKQESKVFREVFAMTDLHHPNIVRYSTCWVELELDTDQKAKGYNEPLTLGDISEYEVSEEEEVSDELANEPTYLSKNSDLGFDWEASAESPEKTIKKDKNEKGLDMLMKKPTEKRFTRNAGRKSSNLILKTLTKSFIEEELEEQSKGSSLSKVESMCEVPGCKLFLYIQMEYCAGQSLKYYLENPKRKVEREKALEMFKKLLEGVNAIHSRGILHRDLKPANIFLDGNENVKIGDFGLASLDKLEEIHEGITPRQLVHRSRILHSLKVGTPMYTSPEQESGGHYDQKTDIYSLGLIFYEMLVNFSTNHERYEHFGLIREKHDLPTVFKKNFPAEGEIILRMTRKSPVERPTAGRIIAEVEKLLEEAKISTKNK